MNLLIAQMNVQGNKVFDRFNFPECRDSTSRLQLVWMLSLLKPHQDVFSSISLYSFFHQSLRELLNAPC